MRQLRSISISKQFYSILKENILKGSYNVGDKLPSIRKFAYDYGISKTTVSSVVALLENEGLIDVIQGKGIYIKKKVEANKLIGALLFSFQEDTKVESGILKGIQKNLEKGYVLSMMDTSNDIDVICQNVDYLVNSGAHGLIILSPKCPEADEKDIERLRNTIKGEIPVVFLLRDIDCPNSDFISVDFSSGIYKAVDYLIKAGKRKIALILHDYHVFAMQETEAYKKAYQDNRCLFDSRYIKEWDDKEKLRDFIDQNIDKIDALISSDQLIYEMRHLILSRSKNQEKDDLYLVGINSNILTSGFKNPTLTVHFPSEPIGKTAISMLTERMEGRDTGGKKQKIFETNIEISKV